jgi:CDP-glucose 4,6-dehydratase
LQREFWQDRGVLVTGANGFIGSWVARVLVERGARVVALVRDLPPNGGLAVHGLTDRVAVVSGSLTDEGLVERALNEYVVDTCFHLAAQAIVTVANRSPISTFESNIRGTWLLLEACRNARTQRVVVASSDKAYGGHPVLPYDEGFALQPLYPYDVSKAASDMLARSYHSTFGLPVAVTRCANIYGGGDFNYSRIIPDSIRLLLQGRPPLIRSDGTPVRDYMYVLDAVEAYLTLAEHMDGPGVAGQAFNFGTQTPVSVLDLVRCIIAVAGRPDLEPIVAGASKPHAEIDAQYLASDRARQVLGWQAAYTLQAGLGETYEWYARYASQRSVPPRVLVAV